MDSILDGSEERSLRYASERVLAGVGCRIQSSGLRVGFRVLGFRVFGFRV